MFAVVAGVLMVGTGLWSYGVNITHVPLDQGKFFGSCAVVSIGLIVMVGSAIDEIVRRLKK